MTAAEMQALEREGLMVVSNLGKKGLEPGDIDPATIEEIPDDFDYLSIYFIGGHTWPDPRKDGQRQYRVLAYVLFDDQLNTPIAQRREVVQATIDLCRVFFHQP